MCPVANLRLSPGYMSSVVSPKSWHFDLVIFFVFVCVCVCVRVYFLGIYFIIYVLFWELSFIQDYLFFLLVMLYFFYTSSLEFFSLFCEYCMYLQMLAGSMSSFSMWFRLNIFSPWGLDLFGRTSLKLNVFWSLPCGGGIHSHVCMSIRL